MNKKPLAGKGPRSSSGAGRTAVVGNQGGEQLLRK